MKPRQDQKIQLHHKTKEILNIEDVKNAWTRKKSTKKTKVLEASARTIGISQI